MKLTFFPIDVNYREIEGKAAIHLFGRSESGERIAVIDRTFNPYFYIKLKEIKESHLEKIKSVEIEDKKGTYKVIMIDEEELEHNGKKTKLLKVFTNLPRAVPELKRHFRNYEFIEGIYEADILFARRYLIDKGITPMMSCEIEGEQVELGYKASTYEAKSITPGKDTIESLRVLALDIETYNPFGKRIVPEKNPILMIAFAGKNFEKVITWKRFETKDERISFVNSEAELIQEFVNTIESYKPEIIAGYFSDGFDLPYIKARADKYKIKLNLGLDNTPIKVKRKGEFPTTEISGIAHLDIFKFVKKIMGRNMDTESYKLDPVAEELLNEKKEIVDLEELANVWDNKVKELERFCKYNLQDSILTYKLAIKILPNAIELIKLVGMPLFDINRMGFSKLVEWYLIKQSRINKQLVPNKPSYSEISMRMGSSFEGAYVYTPKPGIYKNIAVFDFRSLYPTIISSHNIGPDTLNCGCCDERAPIESKNYVFCKNKKGFLPSMIEEIIERRIKVKEILKTQKSTMLEARQNSLKLLANSFYGYLGFFNARWYCLECAESTTAYGRHYIKKSIKEAEEEGFEVLYTDTDSLFLSLKNKTKNEAVEFVKKFNSSLPGIMELEFEGFYKAGIFVFTKSKEGGAKKKYALLSEKNEVKIKGFETVRRNWSFIAKDVQEKVIGIILKENDGKKAMDCVRDEIQNLRSQSTPIDKLTIYTQLQKDIESYENVGPHVAAAKRMRDKGYVVGPGTIVKYIIIKGDTILRDRARLPEEVSAEDYDPEYYVNNQIIPSVEQIFSLLGFSKEDILEEKAQSKLDEFF